MHPGTSERPLRVAIVGSGPSGFYAAAALLKNKDHVIEVDMFDRLPTPFGLVRGGVAPDHQKIKGVIRAYNKTASSDHFTFFGNVMMGRDVSVDQLRELYDMVVLAVGCEGARKLGIPGEDLQGSFSATEFVGWYNAHPDYVDRTFDLEQTAAVIVGVGNVAMDVTRILAKTREDLHPTDIAAHALESKETKRISDIYVLGRRGPAQAAFSPTEIKEIGELENVELVLPERSHVLDPISARWLEEHGDKQSRKNVAYLQEMAGSRNEGAPVRVHLLLCTSPLEVHGEDGRMVGVTAEINELYATDDGRIRPRGTGETFRIDAGLMFVSVGYKGKPIPGIPCNEWSGTVLNADGRIVDDEGVHLPGMYVVGWAKRGPSGLIGTNRADSVATVDQMIADLGTLEAPPTRSAELAHAAIGKLAPEHTTWTDWEQIDEVEVSKGEAVGRIREKFPTLGAMLEAVKP